jgi:lipoprotein-anchoring transpeptidase ErfK/SrfK
MTGSSNALALVSQHSATTHLSLSNMKKVLQASLVGLFVSLGCESPTSITNVVTEPVHAIPEAPAPAAPTQKIENPLRYVSTPSSSFIRVETSSKASILGQTMAKARLPVYEEVQVPGSGCKSEKWLRVQFNGWICADLTREAEPGEELETHIENKTPNQKAQVLQETELFGSLGGKPLFKIEKGRSVSVMRVVTTNGKDFAQISGTEGSAGGFIAAEHLKFLGKGSYKSGLRGEVFTKDTVFPFVIFADETGLAETAGGPAPKPVGKDKKINGPHKKRFERASILEQQEVDGKTYYRIDGGWFAASKSTAIIQKESAPEGLPPGSRWALVDISDQTVVAYEGDQPMWASLAATGKASNKGAFWTVSGSFRLQRKYRVKDMEGNPFGEHYLVEDVPWPQYFFEGYAIHGAFWHNRFGRVTSHGCVNMTPADAMWISEFLDPQIPPGWYALFPTLEMETSVIVVRQ